MVSEEEVRRWRRLHRRSSRRTAAVVVCSELDAERATRRGVRHVEVIPNGYPAVAHPVGRQAGRHARRPCSSRGSSATRPTSTRPGGWPPTSARPCARLVPDVEIRLVGEHPPSWIALDDRPRFTVTGRVPDMAAELARADVVVVPVRYGSGTRLKILEAFAQRVPVVSTTARRRGARRSRTASICSSGTPPRTWPRPAPASCGSRRCAQAVVDRAHALFLERFQSDVIEQDVARLAREVAGGPGR